METERLILRRFESSDWRDLHDYLSDEEVVRFEPYPPMSREDCMKIAHEHSLSDDFWAVCLKDAGKLIGNVYLAKKELDTWELGYVFNRRFQGCGYATEACRALISYMIDHEGARRFVAACNPENSSSWRLLERLGFRREGHLRQHIYFRKDEAGRPIWQDTYEYGILASEWR